MMRSLDLDFQHESRALTGRWRWLPLAIAAMIAAYVVWSYASAAAERARAASRVADAQRIEPRNDPALRPGVALTSQPAGSTTSPNASSASPIVPSIAGELDRVERMLDRPSNLSTALFREIEAAADRSIVLTSIQAEDRDLRITGESASMTALARWIDRLSARSTLAAVYLAGHEWRRVGGRDIVSFTLTAKWVEEAP